MEDQAFITRLRNGDEAAYREMITLRHAGLVRLAKSFCRSQASAEEVVQDAWVTVLTNLDTYSGAAPLRAWIAGIVVNKARQRAVRDDRIRPFSDLTVTGSDGDDDNVDADRFGGDGSWTSPPMPWDGITPEREIGGREMLAIASEALETLPPTQKAVVLLRDVEQRDPDEICRILEISEGNMRVMLHRGRARIRAAVERHAAPRQVRERSLGKSTRVA
jgi:RNA polymerase sigma-70 factor (ECF subfamily)